MKGNRKGCGRTGNGRDTKGGNEGDGVNKGNRCVPGEKKDKS